MNRLYIIGGGSGNADYLLPAAKKAAEAVGMLIASERFTDSLALKNAVPLKNIPKLLEMLPQYLEKCSVGIMVSGDPLLYSLYGTILKRYPDINAEIIPSVSSLQLLGTAFGITMEDALILSIHGREFSSGKTASAVYQNKKVFFLCSKEQGPIEIASALMEYGLQNTEIFIGSDLTYKTERLIHCKVSELRLRENPSLCAAAVINPNPQKISGIRHIPDSVFLRNSSPMTKEEVRAAVISKLRLSQNSIVWDIGAGTGSISAECAFSCPFGTVYSVECKKSALEILKKNKDFLGISNMEIISGRAKDVIKNLPLPDSVFIGGSGNELSEILEYIFSLSKRIRIVMTAVTLETISSAYPTLKAMPQFEAVQLSIGVSKKIGGYGIIDGNNPITIFSCYTEEE